MSQSNGTLRILLITPIAENAHIHRWVEALRKDGHEIHGLFHEQPSPYLAALLTSYESMSTQGAWWSRPWRFLIAIWHWRRFIRRLYPDIVHVHFLSPTPMVLAYLDAPSLVVSVWGSDVASPEGFFRNIFRKLALQSAQVVTASSSALAYATGALAITKRPVKIIPFGIDLDRFQPISRTADPSKEKRLVTVRHLEPIYGIDIFLDALSMLPPDLNWHCAIAGDGSQRSVLLEQCRELGLDDHVDWLGRIPNEAVPNLIQGADLFVLSSRKESFGVAVLEAAACGCPVVATRVGGVPEIVLDGITGVLVEVENPTELAKAILQVLLDDELQTQMSKSAHQHAQKFSLEHCTHLMHAAYVEARSMFDEHMAKS